MGGSAAVGRRIGLRDGLVVAQVAVSLVVLAAAGLFLASLRNATRIDPGFGRRVSPCCGWSWGFRATTRSAAERFYAELERVARPCRGVDAVSLAEIVPLGLARQRRGIEVEGYAPREGEEMEFGVNTVGAGYFETMGIPLVRGRGFAADRPRRGRAGGGGERELRPAILARGGADRPAVQHRPGRRRERHRRGAKDGKYWSLTEEPQPHFYEPFAQAYEADMVLLVRARRSPRAVACADPRDSGARPRAADRGRAR